MHVYTAPLLSVHGLETENQVLLLVQVLGNLDFVRF